MTAEERAPVLVAGLPRSGTTWIGNALGKAAGVHYVHEPDNETREPLAVRGKQGLGAFPYLAPGQEHRRYAECWEHGFAGGEQPGGARARIAKRAHWGASPAERARAVAPQGRLSPRMRLVTALAAPRRTPVDGAQVVVKSVHAILTLDWVVARWRPRVLIVRRHPLEIVASYVELGWELDLAFSDEALERYGFSQRDIVRSEDAAERAAWQTGFFMLAQEDFLQRHPESVVVDHEDACQDAATVIRGAAEAVGLTWTPECDEFLARSDRPGTGYELSRVAAEQHDRWRERLTPDQVDRASAVLSGFERAT